MEKILEGLNPEQRRAAEATRGPVCILAGAGSGKTTTITHRIAWQVRSGAFSPSEILAVTFTDKAAGEMRERLGALGVKGVLARTFHAAALGQLHWLAPQRVGDILASKALLVRRIANSLPRPYSFRPAADLAGEIERAKNRRVTPAAYLDSLEGHDPPVPPELMARVYSEYERRKQAAGQSDFEDLLETAVRLFEEDEQALMLLRERFRCFTVDEYQDVNLLQQTLLDLWLGQREELCAVGDDYQAIYGFTGATPGYLLDLPRRFPAATVVRLEANYRSTPQVLELANRLVPRLGGAPKALQATHAEGPAPVPAVFEGPQEEQDAVVARIRARCDESVPLPAMAILVRTNARAADFEEGLAAAGIPYQGASLLEREAARFLLRGARSLEPRELAPGVRRLARAQGWLERPPARLGEREQTRQADMARIVRLADELSDGELDGGGFARELERRFDPRASDRGVNLLTMHRAKGLEFVAVFLPRLEEKEIPCKKSLGRPDELAEERRLLYVALTRAKRHLMLSWTRKGKPSRFLAELDLLESPAARARAELADERPAGFEELRVWRRSRSKADGVPPYIVFHDATLAAIAVRRPVTLEELAEVAGVGPAKLERYGGVVLAVVGAADAAA
ncbi:MAG: ATP-dependent helicase [Gaiellaceae bacterium]